MVNKPDGESPLIPQTNTGRSAGLATKSWKINNLYVIDLSIFVKKYRSKNKHIIINFLR
ncbi:hypothetical protein HMPREF0208_01060 [Citrobacter koseri]|nr:hypothetical protein HMPREF3220_01983 [Citrobacter koseri]KXA04019.1 hypothetical protein HMPREF3207_01599 [Citrobacter koseri]KXB45765.1 hypothetical protein HMPREF0208_01060 [Citrobacter koseri]